MVTILTTILFLSFPFLENVEIKNPYYHRIIAETSVIIMAPELSKDSSYKTLIFEESRGNPMARSKANACGLFQQQPKWKKTTCKALQTQPIHSAFMFVSTYRKMYSLCGGEWKRCYRRGPYHPSNKEILRANRAKRY